MIILTKKMRGDELKPGDLFSTVGQEYWDTIKSNKSVGERVYIRTEAVSPLGENGKEIYKVTIITGNPTRLISAFPGTGKTYYCLQNSMVYLTDGSKIYDWTKNSVLDSDSSLFDRQDFPQNYIDYIIGRMGKVETILISTHKEVRQALVENNIKFTLVYPEVSLRQEYVKRFFKRGSPEVFINLIERNWEEWIRQLQAQVGCSHIILGKGEYLSDKIKQVSMERGND